MEFEVGETYRIDDLPDDGDWGWVGDLTIGGILDDKAVTLELSVGEYTEIIEMDS